MKRNLISICAVVVILWGTYANADLITFDDLPTPYTGDYPNWGHVPTNYMGATWTGWEVLNGNLSDGPTYQNKYGNSYDFPSNGKAAYNGGNGNLIVSTATSTPFTLDSLYVSSFVQNNSYQSWSARSMTVTGSLGGTFVGSATYNDLPTNAFALWAPNLGGLVDSITVTSSGAGQYWLIDDISITPVPVPGAFVLGILGLGVAGRKLRKHKTA